MTSTNNEGSGESNSNVSSITEEGRGNARNTDGTVQQSVNVRNDMANGEGGAFRNQPSPVAQTVNGSEALTGQDPAQVQTSGKSKGMVIGLLIAAVLAAVAFLSFGPLGLFKSKAANHSIVYVKGNELMVRNLKMKKPISITTSIFEEKDDSTYPGTWTSKQSDDGKLIFFLDSVTSSGEADLYYRKSTEVKPSGKDVDEKGFKIASSINAYPEFQISSDGKYVFYVKEYTADEGGRLYVHNLKDEEKIDGEVGKFDVSKDGQTIYYIKSIKDNVGDLYVKGVKSSSEKEKVDSEVLNIYSISDDGSKIYYTKYDDVEAGTMMLYMKEKGKDKVKLISDVKMIERINNDGTILYLKEASVEYYFKDLFEDDLAGSDGSMKAPVEPQLGDFQKEVYDSYWGYTYTTTDYDAYNKAYGVYLTQSSLYEEKLERDYVRDYYKNNPVKVPRNDLYIYANSKDEKIDEGVSGFEVLSSKGASVLYTKTNQESRTKIKMSTITNRNNVDLSSLQYPEQPEKQNLIVRTSKGKALTILENEKFNNVRCSDDLTKVYLINEFDDEKGTGTLREYIIGSDSITAKNKVDDEVSVIVNSDDFSSVVYIKNVKDESGELYMKSGSKKEKLADDVYEYSVTSKDSGKTLYCLSDYSSKNSEGKLSMIKDGKKTAIADDVYNYILRNDSSLIYLMNYDADKNRFELWYKGNDKPEKIDEDVTSVISY